MFNLINDSNCSNLVASFYKLVEELEANDQVRAGSTAGNGADNRKVAMYLLAAYIQRESVQ